jgi:outer membrane lipoprotein-sorting protein
MKRQFFWAVFFFSMIVFRAGFPAEDPNEIVAKADRIRAPEGSYQFDAVVTSFEGEDKKAENGYRGHIKDLDHTLVEFTTPPSEKGKSLLALGEDLWLYLPNLKKPVRISYQQRLVGDVSNGDMARSNLAADYAATSAGEETVNGQETYVLDLTAKTDQKTYHKIKYWVAQGSYRPVKAEFFTVSGKSIKTGTYEDFRSVAGAVRPMRIVFQDSLQPERKSILEFKDMVRKKLDGRMFTKDYLKTLE